MNDYICPYICSYKTNSGYCGLTGGAENCKTRKFLGYNSETRQFIVEQVAAGNIIVQSLPTNADRIRAMSDEELATFIDEFWSAAWCPDEPPVDPETKQCLLHDGDCRLCILDWLRQEVSD